MAKKHVIKERVAMVSPKGSRVTVGTELAARLRTKGYKAAGGSIQPAVVGSEVPMTEAEVARVAEIEEASDPEATPPPSAPAIERPNRGASLAAWVDFAKAVGFEHAEGASRDEIRDAYEAAHPAE